MHIFSRIALLLSTAFAVSSGLAAETFPSTYQVPVNAPVLIQGATVLTGTGERLDGADVLIADGRIQAVGKGLAAPTGARVVDAHGKWVTPGIIDIHSHLGVYASPNVHGLDDGNEATSPVTANVWAEHSIWDKDGTTDKEPTPPQSAETRLEARDAGGGHERQYPRAHALLSSRRDGNHARCRR
jgi:cytosine/adenosine deaminase-related metal-dependent hydrolase